MSAGTQRPDHYATLGVDPGASAGDIRAAYRTLLRAHHPDRNPGPEAVERTKAIIAAFKVVGDFDQRNYYDWDRRREREAAQAAATVPRRRVRIGLAAGGIGLAMVGAVILTTGRDLGAVRRADAGMAPKAAKVEPVPDPAPIRTAAVTPVPERPAVEPLPEHSVEAPAPPPEAKMAMVDREIARARIKPDPVERIAKSAVASPSPLPAKLAASAPAQRAAPARPGPARTGTDIAQLDQFVMNFYGQSWRYGDAPKRAVLEKTRASFVARRGACVGDTCKRNAYLDLMRDVSSIVETGKPEIR